MSMAFKCNRCGSLYEYYSPQPESSNRRKKDEVRPFPDLYSSQFDTILTAYTSCSGYTKITQNRNLINLCPKCREEFINWFNNPNKERNE